MRPLRGESKDTWLVTDRHGNRDPSQVTGPGVPVVLDITDADQVAAAARRCADVTLLVNNAGVMALSPLIGAPTMGGARQEIETNYLGTLAMCRAFAPVLAANGGGAIVNMLSVVSWFNQPGQRQLRRVQGRRMGPHQRYPGRTGRPGHAGRRRPRRLRRYRHGRGAGR